MEPAPTQEIRLPVLSRRRVELHIRREDLLHPGLSGNKFRKLNYNLQQMQAAGLKTLVTFGGAYSNHIHATAAAGKEFGFRTIGIIRGEELDGRPLNPTLADARAAGMELHFVSREAYARRGDPGFQVELLDRYGPAYLLPEGGTNREAIRGCAEILGPEDAAFNWVCCPVGTGGTLAGLVAGSFPGQRIRGYSALKADDLSESLKALVPGDNWDLCTAFHFGGYARIDASLVRFINQFFADTGIPLDPVYTGKMLYGILDEVGRGTFEKGSRILAIHTGGLQGIRGMNLNLRKKNLPLLQL
ncbi:1-aminocyclopropane-1-carboxylate deaminase/D-cysteine desulfhydrase [Robiginitalea sp. SC105]|uniref:1-aminocyclopropane-1-carboxylate deaminase/D-cysteine desulfhydrase n=1 Tax=Robiginitalea sp. SC105 TaxID=2762332 RepID=UPI0016394EC2|nr:pyridoxal-phosphate dependent enzyme [Robiginitalea sp. SC105]MBC2837718.1 1-aminocyclopropane-1-carboxylate deaminase/D-cysteine desulfhydrase [Robiginitalea sp. SC105]